VQAIDSAAPLAGVGGEAKGVEFDDERRQTASRDVEDEELLVGRQAHGPSRAWRP
jgi:hypothetical protein